MFSRNGRNLFQGQLLVYLTDFHPGNGLKQPSSVLRAGEGLVLKHLLGDLAVKLGGGVGEVRLYVDELL